MYPKGVIYSFHWEEISGEIKLHAGLLKRFFYKLIRTLSVFLFLSPFIYIIFIYTPLAKAEIEYSLSQTFPKKEQVQTKRYWSNKKEIRDVINSAASVAQKEAAFWGVTSDFSLVVPKINAKSKVIPNVSTANEKEYQEALKQGVAHGRGTNFPGEGKTIFLFAHSTDSPLNMARFSAYFYLLGKLEKDDHITVFFADKKYEYKVSETKIVAPSDTSWLKDSGEGERLILQTCYPPGTSIKRMIVVAIPS